jgi:hypothetical protein
MDTTKEKDIIFAKEDMIDAFFVALSSMSTSTILFSNITRYFEGVLNSYHLLVEYVNLLPCTNIIFALIPHINNIKDVTLMILLMDNKM